MTDPDHNPIEPPPNSGTRKPYASILFDHTRPRKSFRSTLLTEGRRVSDLDRKIFRSSVTLSLTSSNSPSIVPCDSLGEKRSSDKICLVLVTIAVQDFYKSYIQHYNELETAIKQKFGSLVDVRRTEGRTNSGFDVYIGVMSSSKVERLVFSRIIEGFFPQADPLIALVERTLTDRRVEERELGKVHCCLIYSDQEHTNIFKRLVNQATSQLVDRIKFQIQMIPVRDVLEVWLNGQLIYSLWYCGQQPVLHDIIVELRKASLGQPFESMPRLRG